MELAIDTSLSMASIALAEEGRVRAELSWHSSQNQSAELLPNLETLLERMGVRLSQIGCLMVAKGPGSFNGVRVGLATAKGLALGLGVPLVGVSLLEAMAFPFREVGLPLCPLLPMGRGELAAALFRLSSKGWERVVAEHLTSPQELASKLKTRTLFCGPLPPEVAAFLKEALGRRVAIVIQGGGWAGLVAALGWQKFKQGIVDSPAALQPLYLRPPSITLPKTKEASNVSTG